MERRVADTEFGLLHPGSDHPGEAELPAPAAPVDRAVIIEVLGANHQVRQRTRLTNLPAIIGRGYDADVLLDDPHVCARHAELAREEDGSLVLRDLGSVNGIATARGERTPRIVLASGDRVRLGGVEMRIVDPSHPVPAAVPLARRDGMAAGVLQPKRALAVCLGALVTFTLFNYQGSAAASAGATAVQEAVYVLAGVALWASAWALATRLVSKNFRFLPHWAWSLGIAVAALVVTAAGEWLDFIGPSIEAGSSLAAFIGLALFPVLIAGHLEIASSMSRRKRWRAALSVGAIVVVLTLVASLGDEDSDDTWSLTYSGTLKPLPARLVPAMSLDEFMSEASSLQEEVDEMAEEEGTTPPDSAEADGS